MKTGQAGDGEGTEPGRTEEEGTGPGRTEEEGTGPGRAEEEGTGPGRAEEEGTEPSGAEGRASGDTASFGRTVARLADARALRAYAHPVRMKLVGLLRTEGPLTATRAGELLGESSGTTSFHLRQLAKYGLVEEAGGGTGREKPWRATAAFTSWDVTANTPEMAAATGLLNAVIAENYFEQLMRWLEASPDEPAEWQEAFLFGDRILYVTAGELAELGRKVQDLIEVYFERQVRPELRPAGSRRVTYLNLAFPSDAGRGTGAR